MERRRAGAKRGLIAALWLLPALGIAAPAAAGRPAELRQIRPIVADDYTRLVIELTHRVRYDLKVVPADAATRTPARLYVDLHGTRLRGAAPQLSPAGGPLLRLRATQVSSDLARLILDVPGLRDPLAFPMLDPFRLIVDVRGDARPLPRTARASPLPPARGEASRLPGIAPRTPPRAAGARALTVVLDPGHGGEDPGARGVDGTPEKEVVLDVARRLRPLLEARGYRVVLTRDRDVFVSLEERAVRANALRADLFVSIHANASLDPEAAGIETYYLSNSDNRATIRLAKMENNLTYMTGRAPRRADVSWIVSDMIQSYKIQESLLLARRIQTAVVAEATRQRGGEVRDLGVKPGPFYVLVGAGMPAVLVEISFLTQARECRALGRPAYRAALAEGLLRGIVEFEDNAAAAATL